MKPYLDMLRLLIQQPNRGDRTGVGTRSIFGHQVKYHNLHTRFPLLTTKKVFWRGVVAELYWMLEGSTNIKPLLEQNVNIWNDWPLRNYREKVDPNITMEEFSQKIKTDPSASQWGELGPVYGKQWRDWNGLDQIKAVLDQLRNNPESRRIIVSAWNASDIPSMAVAGLPPCHTLFQFYTRPLTTEQRYMHGGNQGDLKPSELDEAGVPKYFLDCQLYQRSADVLLGVPFNMAQYSLLTHLLAKCTNMVPGTFVHTFGDLHLYENHVEAAEEQLSRIPRPLPKLSIDWETEDASDPCDIPKEALKIEGYNPHPPIKAAVAV